VAQPGPVVMRPASVAPRGAFDRILSARQAASAAQACAGYATYAGFTNNATNGELITASAICVAESGGQPTVYYCNPTGQDGFYPPVSCSGMYDRGLWQIDNQAWTSISDTCAFMAKCNADGAYAISQRGASFTPWATYTSGTYSHYLAAAQSAVRALRGGTLPSGVAGVCLSRVKYTQNALAVTSTCGSGTGRQQWRVAGRAIRDGAYCLAVASAGSTAAVHLRRCNGSSYQQWTALGNGLLRNAPWRPTIVSVGHRSTLRSFHDQIVEVAAFTPLPLHPVYLPDLFLEPRPAFAVPPLSAFADHPTRLPAL